MTDPVYRRVVIKLSGEYLAGQQGFGIDQPTIDQPLYRNASTSPDNPYRAL